MKKSSPVLRMIQRQLPELNGKFRTIAEQILKDPERIIHEKAADLAARSGADSAQVVRLCQKLGFHGFPDLKAKIMEGFLAQWNTLDRQIAPKNKPISALKQRFREDFTKTINDTLDELDDRELRQAVDMISSARNIYLAGVGTSGMAARDMQIKLLRIGLSAFFIEDVELMRMLCSLLTSDDLLVLISFSGTTASILNLARIVSENQVPILCLTNYPASPLGQCASRVLLTTANEEKLRIGAMTSLIAQLLVIDLIVSLLAGINRRQTEDRIAAMNI